MKLLRYEHHGFAHVGVLKHDHVQKVETTLGVLDILALPIAERNEVEASAGRHHRVPLDAVRLLPPVEPRAMRDFVAFERHIEGMKKSEGGTGLVPAEWYEAPAFLFMNPWALIGPNDDVPMPADTGALDFELELAAVVGRESRNVDLTAAHHNIAGYAVFNDWSARDVQGREMKVGLGPSKGKDFATTLGPWITTADEVDEHRVDGRLALDMTVSVNGTIVGRDNSAHMGWSFEQLLVHAARGAVVGAGDVIASGTAGSGALAEAWSRTGRQDPPPLQVGDVVEMTIECLGTITSRIAPPEAAPDPVGPAARQFQEESA